MSLSEVVLLECLVLVDVVHHDSVLRYIIQIHVVDHLQPLGVECIQSLHGVFASECARDVNFRRSLRWRIETVEGHGEYRPLWKSPDSPVPFRRFPSHWTILALKPMATYGDFGISHFKNPRVFLKFQPQLLRCADYYPA